MSEKSEIRDEIDRLTKLCVKMSHLAEEAEKACAILRKHRPWNDPLIKILSETIDAADELHDDYSDLVGRLEADLREIETREYHEARARGVPPLAI